MATFVTLINWTEQGIAQAQGTVERSERVWQMAEGQGGRVDLDPVDAGALRHRRHLRHAQRRGDGHAGVAGQRAFTAEEEVGRVAAPLGA